MYASTWVPPGTYGWIHFRFNQEFAAKVVSHSKYTMLLVSLKDAYSIFTICATAICQSMALLRNYLLVKIGWGQV